MKQWLSDLGFSVALVLCNMCWRKKTHQSPAPPRGQTREVHKHNPIQQHARVAEITV